MFCKGQTFRLYERGEAGICCDVDGVALGPVKLVERADEGVRKHYRICSAEVLAEVLEMAYGPLPGEVMVALARGIRRVVETLEAGNVPLAMIKAVQLRFPEIEADNLVKMGACEFGKYNHCHDPENGRFCETGGGSGSAESDAPYKRPPNDPFREQSVRSALPPGSNKVASETVGPAQGFVTPAKKVEFTTMNNEIRIETKGGTLRNARDSKSGIGTTLGVGEVIVWGEVYRDKPVTGNEIPIDYFREPVRISAGRIEKKIINLKSSGYVKAYIQSVDTTLPDTNVEIFE